ncbi:MAG: inlA 2 [Planctomycetaceae bacterium]|nr:inlA 2 [Planctomycetaceae bacterium]
MLDSQKAVSSKQVVPRMALGKSALCFVALLFSGCSNVGDVPPLEQISVARFYSSFSEDLPHYIPAFDLLTDDVKAIRALLWTRNPERDPQKMMCVGVLCFATHSGTNDRIALYATEWPPVEQTRFVYQWFGEDESGTYFECGSFLKVQKAIQAAQTRSNRAAVEHVSELQGKLESRIDPKTQQEVVSVLLGKSKVTDSDLRVLASIGNLKSLDLASTQITDAGLENVALIVKLSSLDLSHTSVTDAGLRSLSHLEKLARIDLVGTNVTAAGIDVLSTKLPKCKIRWQN